MKLLKRFSAVALSLSLIAAGYYYLQPTPLAHAAAGPQIFYGRNTDAAAVTTSHRIALNGAIALTSFATSSLGVLPIPGTFSNMRVDVDNAPGGATSWVATLIEGSVTSTGITCTITSATSTCNDDSHTFSATAGRVYHINVVATGGTPAASYIRASIKFTPTTTGDTAIVSGQGALSTTLLRFAPLGSGGPLNTENVRQGIFAEGGTLKNLYIETSAAPGAGASYTTTLRDTAASTTVTCAVSGTSQSCNDLTDQDSTVAANALLDLAYQPSSGTAPAAANVGYGIDFVPTTSGDFIYNSFSQTNDSATVKEYYPIAGTLISATEASTTVIARPMSVTGIAVNIVNAPGAAASGKSRTFTLRQNGNPTGLTCTITETAKTCNFSSTVTLADGDTIDIEDAPTGTPLTSGGASISLIANTNTSPAPSTSFDADSGWFEVL